ncbi:MAG: hypothetical protein ACI9LN_003588 [Saprospiraceae bacterium]|jgi:hypothetical protein
MQTTKKEIRDLLADGKTEAAATATFEYAEYCGLAEAVNGLAVVQSNLERDKKTWLSGQISYEESARHHARNAQAITDWLDGLPDVPVQNAAKKLLDEDRFKKRILYLLLVTKVVVLGRLAYHWSTGGFNKEQFIATLGLLAPALAAYFSAILADYIKAQKAQKPDRRFVSGPLVTMAYWAFPIYALALILFLEMKVKGTFSMAEMNAGLGIVEAVLGGYVGRIVYSFFKKE